MWKPSWLRFGTRRPGRGLAIKAKNRGRVNLALELLENRTVPTTFAVINTLDSGPGSLRQAINQAVNGDTIQIDTDAVNGPILLTSGELPLNHDVTVETSGSAPATISGGGIPFSIAGTRVFEIAGGATVNLDNLNIIDGFYDDPFYEEPLYGGLGGGILNYGTLTLDSCTLSDNTVGGPIGGGENYVLAYGGGIANFGTLTVSNSTVSNNQAGISIGSGAINGDGGGIANFGTLALINSTVSHNSALTDNGDGGGTSPDIYNAGTILPQVTTQVSTAAAGGSTDEVNLMLTASDLSATDQQAGFVYSVDWGDGTATQVIPQTANNGAGLAVSHDYAADGIYLVSETATDGLGNISAPATAMVGVSTVPQDAFEVLEDTNALDGGDVQIGGNAGFESHSPDLVFIWGQGGGDIYTVDFSDSLTVPVIIAGRGEGSSDTLVINGGYSDTNVIAKTPGKITYGDPVTDTVLYSGIPNIVINANGTLQNYINDPGGSTVINGGTGANTIIVSATTGTGVVINGGPSTNDYVVNLGSLAGPVTLNNSNTGANDTLVVNAPANGDSIAVSGNQVTQDSQAVVVSAPLAILTVNDGSSDGSGGSPVAVSALTVPVQAVTLNGQANNFTVSPDNSVPPVAVTDVPQAPSASGGGPYAITYGSGLTLDAFGSSDPENNALTYFWTINGATAASGVNPTVSWTQLQALVPGIGAGQSVDVSVEVNDGLGHIVTADSTLTVDPANLIVIANPQYMVYGSTLPAFTTDYFGLVANDGPTALGGTLSFATLASSTSCVGSYTVIPSGLTSSNYVITFIGGLLTIAPAPLTITAKNTHKAYGQTLDLGDTAFKVSGLFNGDTVASVTLTSDGSAATAAATVKGSPDAIVPSNAVGTGLSNYTITYVDGELRVHKADLTITADDATKTYGQTLTFAGTEFTSSGLLNDDAATSVTLVSDGTKATAGVANSTFNIVASAAVGTGLDNYKISYTDGQLTVNPTTPTVSVSGGPFTYDGNTHAAKVQATGVSGENVSGDFTVTYNGSATVPTDAGTYTVLVTFTSNNANYGGATGSGSITINPATPKVKATGGTFTYSATADAATATVTGVGGVSVNGSFSFTYNGSANAPTNAGTYAVVATFTSGDPDYGTGIDTASITINPAKLKVIVNNDVMLQGSSPPVFSGTVTGLVSGDNVIVNYATTATSASLAATYPISATLTGSAAANYTLQLNAGTLYVVTVGGDSNATGAMGTAFWDNASNAKKINAKALSTLDTLNLVDRNGNSFVPTSAAQVQTWLQGAAASNVSASYSLSAQLADMELNVVTGYVKTNDIVYAGQLAPYNTVANPILGLDSGGFITIGNLLAAANAALSTSGIPVNNGFWQAYDQTLAQVLLAANGNSTFVQQTVPGGP